MNIGIVTTWFPAGGGYVSKAYRHVLAQDHQVFIYARGGKRYKGNSNWDDPQVTWASPHYKTTGIWSWHFRRWIRRNNIQIILFNEQRHWYPLLVARKMGVVIGGYVDYYTQNTVSAFRVYDFLICNTQRHLSVFSWHPQCFYIPWGTDIHTFKPCETKINRPVTFLLNAGWELQWERDRRGTSLALEAFQTLQGECKLLVYSQASWKQMLQKWRDLLSCDRRIEVKTGTFDPFPYTEADVYVYPSRSDGIGLTLPEAISSGLAAIIPDSPPMNEFVVKNETGLCVEVEKYLARTDGYYWAENICSLQQLTDAMRFYIDHPDVLEQHKQSARKFAERNLCWIQNSTVLNQTFENVQRLDVPETSVAQLTQLDCQRRQTSVLRKAGVFAYSLFNN